MPVGRRAAGLILKDKVQSVNELRGHFVLPPTLSDLIQGVSLPNKISPEDCFNAAPGKRYRILAPLHSIRNPQDRQQQPCGFHSRWSGRTAQTDLGSSTKDERDRRYRNRKRTNSDIPCQGGYPCEERRRY